MIIFAGKHLFVIYSFNYYSYSFFVISIYHFARIINIVNLRRINDAIINKMFVV